jgi:DnaJ-class molecular chaperone
MLTEEYSEFVCRECHGTGRVRIKRYKLRIVTCPKCKGLGKLDWIEYITGEHYETKNKNR